MVVLALSAGCSGGGGSGEKAGPTTTTGAVGAGESPGTTDPAITIVLAPGRLTIGGNALPFGAPEFQVSSYLERALGEPSDEDDLTCDAGELRVLEWESLTAYVGAEGFAGWFTDDEAHSTDKSVRVGSSEAALQSAYPTGQFPESTLGREFFVEVENGQGLSAIIEDGDVTTLWSGATCVAR